MVVVWFRTHRPMQRYCTMAFWFKAKGTQAEGYVASNWNVFFKHTEKILRKTLTAVIGN